MNSVVAGAWLVAHSASTNWGDRVLLNCRIVSSTLFNIGFFTEAEVACY
jgi:hypothetical protein